MDEKVEGWEASVLKMLGVALRHLQTEYAGLMKSLQKEWEFVQRVAPDTRHASIPVEYALQDYFLMALFQGVG